METPKSQKTSQQNELSQGKDVEVDHGSKGRKNGSKTNSLNEHRLSKKLKDRLDGGKFLCKSSSSHVNGETSPPTNNTESLDSVTEMAKLIKFTEEVFKRYPQNPHWAPLCSHEAYEKKGEKYGLLLAFADVVKTINFLTKNAPVEDFDNMFKALDYYATYGLSVEPVRDRLKRLKQMCDGLMELHDKKASQMCTVQKGNEKKVKIERETMDLCDRLAYVKLEYEQVLSENEMDKKVLDDLNTAEADLEACFEAAKASWE